MVMGDGDKMLDSVEMVWEQVPREAKVVVYNHLKEAIAKFQRDAAVLNVGASLGAPIGPMVAGNQLCAAAFSQAIDLLMDADPEICHDCGGYHDGPPPHPVDPKGLS